MKHINVLVEKNAEFLYFIPNGTLVAYGMIMVNSNIKAKTDRIFQYIYIYIYIYIYMKKICEATLLESLKF
jgi:hypothetical protein